MDIVKKIENAKSNFDKLKQTVENKRSEIAEIEDEIKRLQGEYRVLVEMGKEQGVVDESGKVIKTDTE